MLLIWYRHSLGIAMFRKGGKDYGGQSAIKNEGANTRGSEDFCTRNCACLIPAEDKNISHNLDEEELAIRKDTLAAGNTYKLFLVLGIVLMIVGFFIGINVAGISVGFGIIFMCTRTVISSRAKAKRSQTSLIDADSEKYLETVDWGLLVLFTGLFIMISATVQTGYPDEFFRTIFDACKEDPTHQ